MKYFTEYLLKLRDPGEELLHSVVVYRTGFTVDENGDEDQMVSLWVAARGYEGGGIIGNHSCICRYDEDFEERLSRCQEAHPESDDFVHNDSNGFDPNDEELAILHEVWDKLDTISSFDLETYSFRSLLPVTEGSDAIVSEGWDPDDLLESVSDHWQLFLKF
jgi:hypothetical protein